MFLKTCLACSLVTVEHSLDEKCKHLKSLKNSLS